MVRLLSGLVTVTVALSSPALAEDDASSRAHFVAGIDLSYVDASGLPSWTSGSVGKLRYDDGTDGIVVSRAFLDTATRVTDTLDFNATLEFYDDDLGSAVDFTEAYAEWRPVPRSANRYRLKMGAFYPAISMENTGSGWSSPYTISSSTINTWLAEELRTVGAELSWSRRPERFGGEHQFSVQAAVFWLNDPTGSLLSWKGWSADDRQSRFGDELPLPPLPQLGQGMLLGYQDPYVAPFVEVDGRAGYYVNGEWRMGNRVLLSAMTYNNRGDQTQVKDGQYAWYTNFVHLGGKLSLPGGIGVLSQWMHGETVMGVYDPGSNGGYGSYGYGAAGAGPGAVDVGYDSKYLMITKALEQHRFSIRYDDFEVLDRDTLPEDDNAEDGSAWTLAYRYAHSDLLTFAAEWLRIRTRRDAWTYYGLEPVATEDRLQLSVMLRFAR